MTSLSNQLNNCLSKKGKEENNVPLSLTEVIGTAEEGFKVSIAKFKLVLLFIVCYDQLVKLVDLCVSVCLSVRLSLS